MFRGLGAQVTVIHRPERPLANEEPELTSQIQNVDTSNPDAVVAQHAADILARFATLPKEVQDIITQHVIHSSLGMARWVERGPQVNDEADLDDYMFEVAGRVGYLLT